jgi:ubiquinone/menaquinone biosynthesis C-methylase UbiE
MFWTAKHFAKPRPPASGTLQQIYDRAATSWQDGISKLGFQAAYAHLMQESLPDARPQHHVLDVGTGTGALAAAYVAQAGMPAQLNLMDISPVMLQAAETRFPGATPLCAGIGSPLSELPPQDLVLSAHVIEHLDDPFAALAWLHNRLRPGGRLVLAVSRPHWCTALVRWRWGQAAFDPETMQSMLHKTGFSEIRAIPFPSGPPSRISCGYTALRPI